MLQVAYMNSEPSYIISKSQMKALKFWKEKYFSYDKELLVLLLLMLAFNGYLLSHKK